MSFWKREAKELGKEVAPGVVAAFFGFLRSLFQGKSARDAAKELGEDVVDVVAEPVEDLIEDGIAHELEKLD